MDVNRKHRPEPFPPMAHCFVADLDTTLVQQILHITQLKREKSVEQDREADNLWAGLEIAERGTIDHPKRLPRRLARLKPVSSDATRRSTRPMRLGGNFSNCPVLKCNSSPSSRSSPFRTQRPFPAPCCRRDLIAHALERACSHGRAVARGRYWSAPARATSPGSARWLSVCRTPP